ncbi:DNA mismatch repair protein mutL [Candidatus Photodesmus blepharus]|uniref:DNA mismatch repair protein MutL n=1 Tax=Candidatus Photodesmus blepharonis TaxID=1179155 RepID=A0A084CNQ9_9GAMM|nr:DNA mismatch repair endonuclease MutL [Candidatus Photodesmus blepharus]KEY91438.1 DNA mismatch repair protein mutL [Candidatus Photodesmus blepharus]
MKINVLPVQVINQISAGEIVERPASVVKELIENSLDSGATCIDVDVENGGLKLIRIRDNGEGISKDELALALKRHATSKIHTLDDLETLISLGFRGEALASISSVSRLTLISRPKDQRQAWSTYNEGRERREILIPAAHPIGTSVEVLNLFFNTPARRKFLRTEKTEFTHIDELLKRIALSCFHVTINMRHNGKIIRQYRAAKNEIQTEKRIIAVCGKAFALSMIKIELKHQGLRVHGWISTPEGARQKSDLQYCYVNGRTIRDRLINHAIKQSYKSTLRADQFVTYVLFIEIDPNKVDVNVHPAKQEVRFNQARLVHDFVYQALSDALAKRSYVGKHHIPNSVFYNTIKEHVIDVGTKSSKISEFNNSTSETIANKKEINSYKGLLDTVYSKSIGDEFFRTKTLGQAIAVTQKKYLVMGSEEGIVLVSLTKAEQLRLQVQLDTKQNALKAQPLLVPLLLELTEELIESSINYFRLFELFGLKFKIKGPSTLMVMEIPQPLKKQNLRKFVPDLLSYVNFSQDSNLKNAQELADWIMNYVTQIKVEYTLPEAVRLMLELEQLLHGNLPLDNEEFVKVVDFSSTIATLSSKNTSYYER